MNKRFLVFTLLLAVGLGMCISCTTGEYELTSPDKKLVMQIQQR